MPKKGHEAQSWHVKEGAASAWSMRMLAQREDRCYVGKEKGSIPSSAYSPIVVGSLHDKHRCPSNVRSVSVRWLGWTQEHKIRHNDVS
jgi:hypothetical protein